MSDTAYDEGYHAYVMGRDEHKNPYDAADIEHKFWSDGWQDAAEDAGFEGIEE